MYQKRKSRVAAVLAIAMVLFVIIEAIELARLGTALWNLSFTPESIVGKIAWDSEGYIFRSVQKDYRTQYFTGLALTLIALFVTILIIIILKSAHDGSLVQQRHVDSSRKISFALAVCIPLRWLYDVVSKKVQAYEDGITTGKLVQGSDYIFNLDLYSILVVTLAIVFSILLQQAVQMHADLEGTV